MSKIEWADSQVKIDTAHAELIKGLVMSSKPRTILEIGVGGGESADAIIAGLTYNQTEYSYDLVDCWLDWNGVMPPAIEQRYSKHCNIITSTEQQFVISTDKTYDFIMSDGDHHRADQWFEHVYDKLLNPNGILIYHDINVFNEPNGFPNLVRILTACEKYGLTHYLFNKNSRPEERCQRGLLVIYKN